MKLAVLVVGLIIGTSLVSGCWAAQSVSDSVGGMMGYDSTEKFHQDSGVLGDRKTREGVVTQTISGVSHMAFRAGATMVTPMVVDDVAQFNLRPGPGYTFDFPGVGWSYSVKAGWDFSTEPGSAYPVVLTSPDGATTITVKVLDLKIPMLFDSPPSESQRRVAELAAIKWLGTGQRIVAVPEDEGLREVSSAVIGRRNFGVWDRQDSSSRTLIYALNYWAYKDDDKPGEQHALVWIVIVRVASLGSAEDILRRTRSILETLAFPSNNTTVYSDLR